MRCPKCHYLSFDPDPRCRNCGYDLEIEGDETETDEASLDLQIVPAVAESASTPDLPLRSLDPVETSRPVPLELVKPAPAPVRVPEAARPEPALAVASVAAESAPTRRVPPRPAPPTTELPLFVKTMGPQELGAFAGLVERVDLEEEGEEVLGAAPAVESADVAESASAPEPVPVVHVPASSRPLSVRRPAVEPARTVAAPRRPGPIDKDLLEDLQRLEREESYGLRGRPAAAVARASSRSDQFDPYESSDTEVRLSLRARAAALDGLLLGGIGAFVLWATLKVAGATPSALGVSSIVPMGIFLAAVAIAYLLMFTAAGGQTVGKMLMGIRVVDDESSGADRVTLGQAASPAILAPQAVVMLGLGWIPAVLGRGPALHDRLAHTRVVRA